MLADNRTQQYFNRFTPHFRPDRFQFALDFLKKASPDQSLIDIGCGDGGTLALIRRETPITNLYGLDIAEAYLQQASTATGCKTLQGSILDAELIEPLTNRFDYAVLGAVLHHLVGATRRASKAAAQLCVSHSLQVIKPGGHLIIFEPSYGPRIAMWGVFWIKRILGSLISTRLELGRSWINIGQPVVSYYGSEQIKRMLNYPNCLVVEFSVVDQQRLGTLIKREGLGIIVQRSS